MAIHDQCLIAMECLPVTGPDGLSLPQVWAPYYTLHKLLAGLLHQYTLAGNHQALQIAEALGGYIGERVRKLAKSKGLAHQFKTLNQVR